MEIDTPQIAEHHQSKRSLGTKLNLTNLSSWIFSDNYIFERKLKHF